MNASMHRGMAAGLAIWLAAISCNYLTGTPTSIPTQGSPMPVPIIESAPPAPPTAETVQPPNPTPQELTWFPSVDSHCRSGPGIQYESLTMLWSGQRLAALAVDPGWNWVQVRMQLSTQPCWTRSDTGNLSGDMSQLLVVDITDPLPTATLPKPVHSGSDIDVLRVGASQQEGRAIIYLDIRNDGPADYSGQARVVCLGKSKMRDAPYTQASIGREGLIELRLSAGSTDTINTGVETDTASYSYPSIQCAIVMPGRVDLNSDNNIGKTSIP